MATINGTPVADLLDGTPDADTIIGFGGDDLLLGRGGDDKIDGSIGNDRVEAGDGNDTVLGGAGDDALSGGDGGDILRGGDGSDTLDGGNGDDRLEGGTGPGLDSLNGGNGSDILVAGSGGSSMDGGAGSDVFIAGAGKDQMFGNEFASDGSDRISYENSTAAVDINLLRHTAVGGYATGDTFSGALGVIGSDFDDRITGDGNTNWISGGAGDDVLWGSLRLNLAGPSPSNGDVLSGGDGNDRLLNGEGSDSFNGGDGVDWVYYETTELKTGATVNLLTGVGGVFSFEHDTYFSIENVYGSAFADKFTGNAQTNVLYGGLSSDTLTGGRANDYFLYRAVSESTVAAAGRDTITDFSHAEGDKIDLRPIDADGNGANGNTAFTFTPGGVFSGSGHEVIVQGAGAGIYTVLADVNGDKVADMAITVHSATALVAADFLL